MSKGASAPITTGSKHDSKNSVAQRTNRGASSPVIQSEGGSDCARSADVTALPPVYTMVIRNPPTPAIDATCLWQDDNGILVQENDNDTICIDNA